MYAYGDDSAIFVLYKANIIYLTSRRRMELFKENIITKNLTSFRCFIIILYMMYTKMEPEIKKKKFYASKT